MMTALIFGVGCFVTGIVAYFIGQFKGYVDGYAEAIEDAKRVTGCDIKGLLLEEAAGGF